jgi:hypothetical protein
MEYWRDIPRYLGMYQASSQGCVRGLDRIGADGRRLKGKVLKAHFQTNYLAVVLRKDGKNHNERVHVLVLEAFKGPRPLGFEAGHRNHVKTDNRSTNLEWITHSANNSAIRHDPNMPRSKVRKLTADQMRSIKQMLAEGGRTQTEIGRLFGVDQSTVWCIKTGRRNYANI